jgi:hypothetical protein
MRIAWLIPLLCLFAAPAAAMELRPLTGAAPGPYLPADLFLAPDDIPDGVDRLHIRWALGGPTVVVPLPLAGAPETSFRVHLPPDGLVQEFTVTALAGDKVLDQQSLSVYWPEDIDARRLVYSRWARPIDTQRPYWPMTLRGVLVLIVSLAAAAIWLACWVLPARWRWSAFLAASLIATLAAAFVMQRHAGIQTRRSSKHPDVAILTSLRSQRHHIARPCVPVYLSRGSFIADDSLIAPDGTTVSLAPGRIVLLLDWSRGVYSPGPSD